MPHDRLDGSEGHALAARDVELLPERKSERRPNETDDDIMRSSNPPSTLAVGRKLAAVRLGKWSVVVADSQGEAPLVEARTLDHANHKRVAHEGRREVRKVNRSPSCVMGG